MDRVYKTIRRRRRNPVRKRLPGAPRWNLARYALLKGIDGNNVKQDNLIQLALPVGPNGEEDVVWAWRVKRPEQKPFGRAISPGVTCYLVIDEHPNPGHPCRIRIFQYPDSGKQAPVVACPSAKVTPIRSEQLVESRSPSVMMKDDSLLRTPEPLWRVFRLEETLTTLNKEHPNSQQEQAPPQAKHKADLRQENKMMKLDREKVIPHIPVGWLPSKRRPPEHEIRTSPVWAAICAAFPDVPADIQMKAAKDACYFLYQDEEDRVVHEAKTMAREMVKPKTEDKAKPSKPKTDEPKQEYPEPMNIDCDYRIKNGTHGGLVLQPVSASKAGGFLEFPCDRHGKCIDRGNKFRLHASQVTALPAGMEAEEAILEAPGKAKIVQVETEKTRHEQETAVGTVFAALQARKQAAYRKRTHRALLELETDRVELEGLDQLMTARVDKGPPEFVGRDQALLAGVAGAGLAAMAALTVGIAGTLLTLYSIGILG